MSWEWALGAGSGAAVSFIAWLVMGRVSEAAREGRTDEQLEVQKSADGSLRSDLKEFRADVSMLGRDLRAELTDAMDRMRQFAADFKASQASQDKVNQYTTKAIEAITIKQERHEDRLNDHASTIKLINQLLERIAQDVQRVERK